MDGLKWKGMGTKLDWDGLDWNGTELYVYRKLLNGTYSFYLEGFFFSKESSPENHYKIFFMSVDANNLNYYNFRDTLASARIFY